jgi:hypothetical protein
MPPLQEDSCYSLQLEAESARAIVQLEGLDKLKIFSDLIGNQIHGLPACSIPPQPTDSTFSKVIVLELLAFVVYGNGQSAFNK